MHRVNANFVRLVKF